MYIYNLSNKKVCIYNKKACIYMGVCMCVCCLFFFFFFGGVGVVLINILVPQVGPQTKIPSFAPTLPCYVYPWLWHYIYLAYEPIE